MDINQQDTNKNKWIWIGLGAAVLFCCCAVVVAGLVFRQIGQKVQQSVKTDPEGASQAAHSIVDYDLPHGYEEQMAVDFGIYTIAMIGPQSMTSISPVIMLAQYNQSGVDGKQMEDQVRQSFEQQYGVRGLDMHLVEVKKMNIRGHESDVAVYEGSDQNGNSMRQWVTSFPGKDGTAVLVIMGDLNHWDQSIVDDFIKSIR